MPRRPGRGRRGDATARRCRVRPPIERARPASDPGTSRRSTTAARYSPVPATSRGRPGDGRRQRCRRRREVGDGERLGPARRGRGSGAGTPGSALGGRLGRADVHAAVHLHGVDGDDLRAGTAVAAAMATSDLPDAVGPSTTTGALVTRPRRGSAGGAPARRRRSTSWPVRWCGAAPVISTSA